MYRNQNDRFNDDDYDVDDYDAQLPCAHKEAFKSRHLAETRLRTLYGIREWEQDAKRPTRVYECLEFNDGRLGCMHWHLTSAPARAGQEL